MKKVIRLEEVEFKNSVFNVELEYYYDEDLEEEYVDVNLGNDNLRKIRNEYRRINDLLLDYNIKQIREKYDLSQKEFAILLGFGEITITRYESKTVQEKAHDEIIRKAKDAEEFYKLALKNKEKYVKEYSELKYNKVLAEIKKHFSTNNVEIMYNKKDFNTNLVGNKELSMGKIYAIIKFFAANFERLTKTKLSKCLWYVDNLSYKETGFGITGLTYNHLPYGAVPFMYEDILNNDIVTMDITFNGDTTTCLIKSCDTDVVLTEYELSLVKRVLSKFKDMNTSEVVSYMHKEVAYIETKKNEFISYEYASYIDF